jgi:RimJ/RimL family protein N-acetyltransferase
MHAPLLDDLTECVLTPFSESLLADRYVSWLNNPSTMRFSENRHRIHTAQSCREFVESFKDGPDLLWAIVVAQDGIGHVGNIVARVDRANELADVSIMIGDSRVRGKGVGLAAWTRVCRYLLLDHGIRKVSAGTLAANKPMLSVMEKAGMRPDGRRIRHYLVEGEEVDMVHACLFREDLAALPRR